MRIPTGQNELETAREDVSSFVGSDESGFGLSRPAGNAQSGRVERLSWDDDEAVHQMSAALKREIGARGPRGLPRL